MCYFTGRIRYDQFYSLLSTWAFLLKYLLIIQIIDSSCILSEEGKSTEATEQIGGHATQPKSDITMKRKRSVKEEEGELCFVVKNDQIGTTMKTLKTEVSPEGP